LVEAMIVAGIGCRKGASAAEVEAAIAAALVTAGFATQRLDLIATPAVKGEEPGIVNAALARGVPLVLVPRADLEATGGRTVSHSERVLAIMGVPSAAEAAALAAAGPTARLVGPRIAVGPATCALATTGDAS
jgi:cobalt-precorrin 5A hydrolase